MINSPSTPTSSTSTRNEAATPSGQPRSTVDGLEDHPKAPGVWMTFSWDMGATDVRPHASEMDALRHVNAQGYGQATFVPFGSSCEEASA